MSRSPLITFAQLLAVDDPFFTLIKLWELKSNHCSWMLLYNIQMSWIYLLFELLLQNGQFISHSLFFCELELNILLYCDQNMKVSFMYLSNRVGVLKDISSKYSMYIFVITRDNVKSMVKSFFWGLRTQLDVWFIHKHQHLCQVIY